MESQEQEAMEVLLKTAEKEEVTEQKSNSSKNKKSKKER